MRFIRGFTGFLIGFDAGATVALFVAYGMLLSSR